jgi:hypothetical protein
VKIFPVLSLEPLSSVYPSVVPCTAVSGPKYRFVDRRQGVQTVPVGGVQSAFVENVFAPPASGVFQEIRAIDSDDLGALEDIARDAVIALPEQTLRYSHIGPIVATAQPDEVLATAALDGAIEYELSVDSDQVGQLDPRSRHAQVAFEVLRAVYWVRPILCEPACGPIAGHVVYGTPTAPDCFIVEMIRLLGGIIP